MIKKIPDILDGGLCNSGCAKKINELVDAINELKDKEDEVKEWIGIVSDLREQVKQLKTDKTVGLIYVEPEPKAIRDPYAEQRKWIGGLCKFDGEHYGILKRISNPDTRQVWKDGPFGSSDGNWYSSCEPVKPDDELIYKGEQNVSL